MNYRICGADGAHGSLPLPNSWSMEIGGDVVSCAHKWHLRYSVVVLRSYDVVWTSTGGEQGLVRLSFICREIMYGPNNTTKGSSRCRNERLGERAKLEPCDMCVAPQVRMPQGSKNDQ